MDTIFMNFENSKTSGPHKLLCNLLDKIKSFRGYKIPGGRGWYKTSHL